MPKKKADIPGLWPTAYPALPRPSAASQTPQTQNQARKIHSSDVRHGGGRSSKIDGGKCDAGRLHRTGSSDTADPVKETENRHPTNSRPTSEYTEILPSPATCHPKQVPNDTAVIPHSIETTTTHLRHDSINPNPLPTTKPIVSNSLPSPSPPTAPAYIAHAPPKIPITQHDLLRQPSPNPTSADHFYQPWSYYKGPDASPWGGSGQNGWGSGGSEAEETSSIQRSPELGGQGVDGGEGIDEAEGMAVEKEGGDGREETPAVKVRDFALTRVASRTSLSRRISWGSMQGADESVTEAQCDDFSTASVQHVHAVEGEHDTEEGEYVADEPYSGQPFEEVDLSSPARYSSSHDNDPNRPSTPTPYDGPRIDASITPPGHSRVRMVYNEEQDVYEPDSSPPLNPPAQNLSSPHSPDDYAQDSTPGSHIQEHPRHLGDSSFNTQNHATPWVHTPTWLRTWKKYYKGTEPSSTKLDPIQQISDQPQAPPISATRKHDAESLDSRQHSRPLAEEVVEPPEASSCAGEAVIPHSSPKSIRSVRFQDDISVASRDEYHGDDEESMSHPDSAEPCVQNDKFDSPPLSDDGEDECGFHDDSGIGLASEDVPAFDGPMSKCPSPSPSVVPSVRSAPVSHDDLYADPEYSPLSSETFASRDLGNNSAADVSTPEMSQINGQPPSDDSCRVSPLRFTRKASRVHVNASRGSATASACHPGILNGDLYDANWFESPRPAPSIPGQSSAAAERSSNQRTGKAADYDPYRYDAGTLAPPSTQPYDGENNKKAKQSFYQQGMTKRPTSSVFSPSYQNARHRDSRLVEAGDRFSWVSTTEHDFQTRVTQDAADEAYARCIARLERDAAEKGEQIHAVEERHLDTSHVSQTAENSGPGNAGPAEAGKEFASALLVANEQRAVETPLSIVDQFDYGVQKAWMLQHDLNRLESQHPALAEAQRRQAEAVAAAKAELHQVREEIKNVKRGPGREVGPVEDFMAAMTAVWTKAGVPVDRRSLSSVGPEPQAFAQMDGVTPVGQSHSAVGLDSRNAAERNGQSPAACLEQELETAFTVKPKVGFDLGVQDTARSKEPQPEESRRRRNSLVRVLTSRQGKRLSLTRRKSSASQG